MADFAAQWTLTAQRLLCPLIHPTWSHDWSATN
jgi:hypothetical protein